MTTSQQTQTTIDLDTSIEGLTVYFANGVMAASVGGPAPVGRTMLRRYMADGTMEPQLVAMGIPMAHRLAREFCEERAA